MKKNIMMTMLMITFIGCSNKKPIPAEQKQVNVSKVKVESSKVENKKIEEFIPEHIRKSNIEVVKRN